MANTFVFIKNRPKVVLHILCLLYTELEWSFDSYDDLLGKKVWFVLSPTTFTYFLYGKLAIINNLIQISIHHSRRNYLAE